MVVRSAKPWRTSLKRPLRSWSRTQPTVNNCSYISSQVWSDVADVECKIDCIPKHTHLSILGRHILWPSHRQQGLELWW
jgi:hypothetical protein